jgi:hypothetical protein
MNKKKAIGSTETLQQTSSTTPVANHVEDHLQHLTVQTNNLTINQRTRRHSKTHNLITLKREGVILTREFSRSHEVREIESNLLFLFYLYIFLIIYETKLIATTKI